MRRAILIVQCFLLIAFVGCGGGGDIGVGTPIMQKVARGLAINVPNQR
jgi:hypothetical protein